MIRIYAMAAIAALIIGLGWYAKHQTERAATAEAAARGMAQSLTEQQALNAEYQEKLNRHEKQRQAIQSQANQWRARWENAKKNPEVQEWARNRLPHPVADRLCELARCDNGNGTDTGAPPGSHPDPPVPEPG